MGVNLPDEKTCIEWVIRSCERQGVPVKITDPATIRKVVILLGQSRQTASTRSGSKKRVRPRTAGQTIARSKTDATIPR